MASVKNEQSWLALARASARRLNWAWFLEKLSLPLLLAGLLGACAILLARREWAAFPWQAALAVAALIVAVLILVAWLLARRHFTTPETALVRLESAMLLNNSLTAAHHGIAPWPAVASESSDGTTWHWRRLLTPPLATLCLLSLAFLLPISARSDDFTDSEEPTNRQSLQASLDELRRDEVIDEEYLDEMEEKVQELREQPKEEWFDHSALEATDSLKESHQQQLKELERDLRKAERALNALQNHGQNLGSENRERLLNEFDQSLQKMQSGAMKPNQELLQQLKGLDPKDLGQLNPEQLDQLRENMREQAQKMQNANGENQPGQSNGAGDEWLDELMQEGGQDGDGEGQPGENPGNQPGNQPGSGGLNRGPGTAPGVLGAAGEKLKIGDLEGLESRDLSNTLPGDLLELQEGEHQVDRSPVEIRSGGAIDDLGEGGDLIWKVAPDLHPDEKKALREFFR